MPDSYARVEHTRQAGLRPIAQNIEQAILCLCVLDKHMPIGSHFSMAAMDTRDIDANDTIMQMNNQSPRFFSSIIDA